MNTTPMDKQHAYMLRIARIRSEATLTEGRHVGEIVLEKQKAAAFVANLLRSKASDDTKVLVRQESLRKVHEAVIHIHRYQNESKVGLSPFCLAQADIALRALNDMMTQENKS